MKYLARPFLPGEGGNEGYGEWVQWLASGASIPHGYDTQGRLKIQEVRPDTEDGPNGGGLPRRRR
ncbi:protein of unknown function [Methylococcus capsulatus]|uniref:Uncharacterized protein n=1 Tax=Methylococcus capsulatus TaxID=414 RepID=A0AA35UI24_METCP|nr:protein of unknown function [Methylococcus capsulatus]